MNYRNNITTFTGIRDELAFIASDVLAIGALSSRYIQPADEALTTEEENMAVADFFLRFSEELSEKIKNLDQAICKAERKSSSLPVDPDAEKEPDQIHSLPWENDENDK